MKRLIPIISILLLLGCSAEKRMARILENHPELAIKDTIEKQIITELKIKTDTVTIDSLNSEYLANAINLYFELDSLRKISPCKELANKIEKTTRSMSTIKRKIDTVYMQSKCVVEPLSFDTLGLSVKISTDGNNKLKVDVKSLKTEINIDAEESEFWQFLEFWGVVGLLIFAIYFRFKR